MNLLRCPSQDASMGFRERFARRCAPVSDGVRICHTDLSEYSELAVAIDKLHWNCETQEERQCFTRHRARKDIAADHYLVHVCDANVFKHRFERRKIRVNVVQSSDSHAMPLLAGLNPAGPLRTDTANSVSSPA